MIPVLMKIRAASVQHYDELIRHTGEEYVYVLKGSISVRTEFYDPVVLSLGESIYLDGKMGHACVTADACDEAIVLALSSHEMP